VLLLAGIYAEYAGKCQFSGLSRARNRKKCRHGVKSAGAPARNAGGKCRFFENLEKMVDFFKIE
jgi:hypothetical protein